MTTRIFPPLTGSKAHTAFGRPYAGQGVAFLDVPDSDAAALTANAWLAVAPVGATSARPASPKRGDKFLDTTLGYIIVYDGVTWRKPIDGTTA